MSGEKVLIAFEALIEALREERSILADALREATLQGNLTQAQRHLDQARHIERFLSAVEQLRDAWIKPELQVPAVPEPPRFPLHSSPSPLTQANELSPELVVAEKILSGGQGRDLQRGNRQRKPLNRTPETAFYIPILEALEELGGRGHVQQVIDFIYERMRDRLTEDDLAPLPSGTDVRWRNNVMWARNDLVRLGLLRADSPRGIWEITDAGRAYLQRYRRQDE